ncbi:MAG: peptidase MA family metallohydrolase [Candidatus Omnitrophota bacterium]|jgi:hypothetical protein
MIKRLIIALTCLCLFPASLFGEDFLEERSEHFFVYYYKGIPADFVSKTIVYCERYYKNITDSLGYTRFNFWTWNDRAKIYIYPDQIAFRKNTNQAYWSAGAASYEIKTIWTFPQMAGFFDSILPHELGHIIFREVIGPYTEVPLWLEEGVASFQESGRRHNAAGMVKQAIKEGRFIPLDRLSQIDVRVLTDRNEVDLFYSESVSVVDYLVTRYGASKFAEFCVRLKNGNGIDNSLRFVYDIKDLNELNDRWKNKLDKNPAIVYI